MGACEAQGTGAGELICGVDGGAVTWVVAPALATRLAALRAAGTVVAAWARA